MKKFITPLIAALALIFSVTGIAAPAQAHDEVTASYPEANSTVEAGTFAVSVTFNEDVMQVADNSGIAIAITGPDGKELATSCLSVNGPEISALASLDKAGEYKVDWRSVSGDGHANSGNFSFTLTNNNDFVAEDVQAACDASKMAVGSPMPLIAPAPVAMEDNAEESNSGSMTWIGLGIGAALIVAGSVAGAIRFRIKERKQQENPEILSDDKYSI